MTKEHDSMEVLMHQKTEWLTVHPVTPCFLNGYSNYKDNTHTIHSHMFEFAKLLYFSLFKNQNKFVKTVDK